VKRPSQRERALPMPLLAGLRPESAVDDELDWFFNLAESEMGVQSSYHACLSHHDAGEPSMTFDDVVEATHRHGRIRQWLNAIPSSDAGVLQAAYEQRPWPVALYDALGHLTGIYVRLACALDPWPTDRESQQVVEMARAAWVVSSGELEPGHRAFVLRRRDAEVRLAKAHQAYAAARGSGHGRPS
jgi:hypothetical protein